MKDLKLFLDLIRIKKPIGIMLLFWPCLWGLTLANNFNDNNFRFLLYLIYFFLGSVLMRSAGCIVNDILDRKYDVMVERTKKRPIASGKISVNLGLVYVIILCSTAFLILMQFNFITILLGLASMPFAFSYPLMKRYTYWPQLFLGFTFNWGSVMAWTSIMNDIDYLPIIFYIGAIFWTLGYDTIYGLQDASEDEIIGVKSTAIKFKKNLTLFVTSCYFISSILMTYVIINLEINYFFIFLILFMLSLFYQIKVIKPKKSYDCLKAFKLNNYSGLFLFLSIFLLSS